MNLPKYLLTQFEHSLHQNVPFKLPKERNKQQFYHAMNPMNHINNQHGMIILKVSIVVHITFRKPTVL